MAFLLLSISGQAQPKRYVVIDQDASGPGGTDMNSILVLLQAPNVDVLGITVVTGDGWRNEEVAHALRLLELVGRADIPVVPGSDHPMLRTREWTRAWEQLYGKLVYQGAWTISSSAHDPDAVPNLREGNPTTKPSTEGAAQFMVRMVLKYPHQVTIFALGPMTDIATAILLDPEFASLAKDLVFMGGSLNPHTNDPEFMDNPRHEFNLWFDPEASSIVLHAPWPRITATTVDASIETRMTPDIIAEIAKSNSPAAQYVARYDKSVSQNYLWDELAAAAWLDPTLITHERYLYMDVSTEIGVSNGNTLIWTDSDKPAIPLRKVHAQTDINWPKFRKMFIHLMSAPTPEAKNPEILTTKGQ